MYRFKQTKQVIYFGIFYRIFMKFSLKCRTQILGMIYTILGSFCSFLIGKGPLLGPKSGLGKIPVFAAGQTCLCRSLTSSQTLKTGFHASQLKYYLFCLFESILYVPSTIFQFLRDRSSWVEPVLS